jgi:thiol-disulfide isomerase/thioredoxin
MTSRFRGPWVAAFLGVMCVCQASRAVDVGDTPDFDVTNLDGQPLKLSDFRGKLVLIDFWATWCGPCMAEAEHMVELQKKYGDKGLQIIGVSLDSDESELRSVIAAKNFTWPQYYDGGGWRNVLAGEWGVKSIPATFILDPTGKVVWKGHPARIDEALEAAFKKTPPSLIDEGTRSRTLAALDFVEKNVATDLIESVKQLGGVPSGATQDATLARRLTAATALVDAACDKQMAEVEAHVTEKAYGKALEQLKRLAGKLDGYPLGKRAQKRLDELKELPEVKAQLKDIDLAVRAEEMLASGVKFQSKDNHERAYLVFIQVNKQFPKTDAAKTARSEIVRYEKDPAFVMRAKDLEAGERAKGMLGLARSYRAVGNREQAMRKYQQVVAEFPGTSFAKTAQQEMHQ